ncbi:hypothetical protein FHS43_004455 [Streptosporangium becharense]|uniref:Uncharacterized protein n=1 Tax=Streptosporangium becharense TaxID=1816182 RepID=A0A7W9IKK1_9ACTN|nr:hypothetical protein [Streptosporangium becharense]MBB2913157.1 hypothetical protein [Streptosporangium becharense]MBB5822140.1 hypothetical protein [Streptosporangium becharense]
MTLYVVLYGLSCASCGVDDRLWQDVIRGVVECRACGERAVVGADIGGEPSDLDGEGLDLDGFDLDGEGFDLDAEMFDGAEFDLDAGEFDGDPGCGRGWLGR